MFTRMLVGSALVIGLCALALGAVVAAVLDLALVDVTGDYHWTFDTSPAIGALSVFNTMSWAVAGALSLFVAWALPAARRRMSAFGALMLAFVADDAFMVHESVGPYLLGIPQVAFYIVYACTALWVLMLFRQSANRSVTKVYVLGGGLLATSILIDLVRPDLVFIEDSAKLLGTLVFVTVPVLTFAAHRSDVLAPGRSMALATPRPRSGSEASMGGVS